MSLSVFRALGEAGSLQGRGVFVANSTGTALDDNDYILYNTTTGALLYDADGSGARVAVRFATLTNKPEIKENDFEGYFPANSTGTALENAPEIKPTDFFVSVPG